MQAPDRPAAVDAGRDPEGRRSVLGAARLPRAGRCAAAAARQRAGDRHHRGPHRGRRRRGARDRPDAARAPVALAGARDHPFHEADAEARGPDRRARSSPSSSPARRSPARCSSWRWPPTAPTCSTTTTKRTSIALSPMNFGPLTMSNGLTRLQTRFLDDAGKIAALVAHDGAAQRGGRRRGRPRHLRARRDRLGRRGAASRSRRARRSRPTR